MMMIVLLVLNNRATSLSQDMCFGLEDVRTGQMGGLGDNKTTELAAIQA
jgi:hypothetical protein